MMNTVLINKKGAKLRDLLRQDPSVRNADAVLPSMKNAKEPRAYDEWRYQERHLIECFIDKNKHFRCVFSRFGKLAKRYHGFVQLVNALIWLR